MPPKIQVWVSAMRLRTLPLALSCIIAGNALAYSHNPEAFNFKVFALAAVTTLCLQVLSNFANDYGDSVKGTDNEKRIGPKRALQSGVIQPSEMKMAMYFVGGLAFMFGVWLIVESLHLGLTAFFFLLLGIAAIVAAVKYTVGKNAYGYKAMGDVFVFLFFGIVGVCGSYFLQQRFIQVTVFLPAIAIGCMAASVLHLNNMRDMENDAHCNKITLAVMLGLLNAKRYFVGLIFVAALTSMLFCFTEKIKWQLCLLVAITFIPFVFSAINVCRASSHKAFDPLLKVNALATFGYSVAFSAAVIFSA